TEVSGRGIGLHVVLTDAESLGGTVHVSTAVGRGTTFRLTVPITTARSSMLVFRVHSGRYAVPSSSVVGLVDANACERLESVDGPLLRYQGDRVRLVQLDQMIGESREADRSERLNERLLIIHDGRARLALAGSSHHGEQEVVLKPMGRLFEQQRLVSAAAPLGDGSLALVLTVGEIFSLARGGLTHRARGAPPAARARRAQTVLVVDDSPLVRDLIA